MNSSFCRSSAVILVAGFILPEVAGPVTLAQPPEKTTIRQTPPMTSPEAVRALAEWPDVQKRITAQARGNATDEIAQLQTYYEQHGYHSNRVSVEVALRIARLYHHALNNPDKALEIYDWAIGRYNGRANIRLLQNERRQLLEGSVPFIALITSPVTTLPPPSLYPAIPLTTAHPFALQVSPAVPVAPSLPASSVHLALPGAVNSKSAMRSTFLLQLQAAPQEAEMLWEKSGLAVPDLIGMLEESAGASAARRRALAGLLVKHGAEHLAPPVALSAKVRLAVADYYAAAPDEKAVPLYRQLLEEAERQGPAWRPTPALGNLAEYYRKTGRDLEAADVYSRIEKFTYHAAYVGNFQVLAARLYHQAGEEQKADELYQKVIETPSDWAWSKGLALADQASTLITQGRYEEARKLLKTSITGQYAEQMKIGMLALLSYSYFETKNFEESHRYSQEAVTQYESLGNPLQGEGLQELVEATRNRLQLLEKWKAKAFEMPIKKLLALRDEGGVYHVKLHVHSFQEQPIKVDFKDNVKLIRLTQLSQQRVASGVVVTVYNLAYQIGSHPVRLEAKVTSLIEPQEQQTIEFRSRG